MLPRLAKWFDVRSGEGDLVTRVAVVLFFVITGHTLLETARDALFLTELEPDRLAVVYGLLAVFTLGVAPISSKLCRRYGEKRALVVALLALAVGTSVFATLPKNASIVFALYLWTGIATSLAVAQFWMLATRVFTIAQAKRLLGPIAAAGILGGVAGGAIAVGLLRYFSINELLPAAAVLFVVASVPVRRLSVVGVAQHQGSSSVVARVEEPSSDIRRYVRLVALLIATATIGLLCVDYMFKATTARSLEAASLATFFALYYGGLNLLALLVQLFLVTRLLRRLGVLASLAVLPALLLLGSSASLIGGAGLILVLILKGADGSLRHSLHRTALELLWMPVPPKTRADAKLLVDTFVVRAAQALGAVLIFGLSWWGMDQPPTLTLVVAGLTAVWVGLTVSLRGPYVALLRRALQDDRDVEGPLRLNLASLEVLIEALASMNPSRARAAIQLLASNSKSRLIPALVLFHPSPEVLLSALEHVPAPDREDWIGPVRRLAEHDSEAVRVAAMGALLRHGIPAPVEERLSSPDPAIRGHAAFVMADRSPLPPETHPSVMAIVRSRAPTELQCKIGLLEAIGTQRARRWTPVITSLMRDPIPEVCTHAISVAAHRRDARLIPSLVEHLVFRKQRDLARDALVEQGSVALVYVADLLRNASTEPRLRRHLPRTLSRFAGQAAADILCEVLDSDAAGLIRYKVLRGLCRLITEASVSLDGELLQRLLRDNLVENLRTRAYHDVIYAYVSDTSETLDVSARLLLDLLADKASQALERTSRMLQLLNPTESIRDASDAMLSGDKTAHAQAVEYLANLTLDLDWDCRELLRIATDNLDAPVRIALSRGYVADIPDNIDQALVGLVNDDDDDSMRAITAYYLERAGSPRLQQTIRQQSLRSVSLDEVPGAVGPRGSSIAS